MKIYPAGRGREVYRNIEICGSSTLNQLCQVILESFDFIDEHLYANPISNALIAISNVLTKKNIPYYIGFPKYSRFFADYELLNKFGYNVFFGTHSLFAIAQKYGRI